MTHDPPADLDDIILAYLNAVDAGERPDPSAWLARYPHFADQLRPFFSVESRVGRIAMAARRNWIDDTPGPGRHRDDVAEPLNLGDRFEVVATVGHGGMGDVVRVRDKLLGRVVAIKVLQRRHRSHYDMAQRFVDEARIAGFLQHPGVPAVHDIGTTPDGRPFLVMKLIEGSTLADQLRARPDPSHNLSWFLKVFEQVAQTVAYAHSRGVLHRDLKPHNVMSGAFGEVQVMDWGLAKSGVKSQESGVRDQESGDSDSLTATRSGGRNSETQAGTVIGTPAYMAPEQARGETDCIDARADVFGLGAILCEILTGRPPFTGEQPLEQAKRGDMADALQRLDGAACDPELTALARRSLDPDPAQRPPDGQAVALAVVGYLAGVQERLRQSELADVKATAVRRQRRVVRGLGILAVSLLVLGLTAVLVVQARANANLTEKNTELAAANDRERQRFNLALDAIGYFHGEVSQDFILKEKQFSPLRTKLLRGAADFYGKLEAQSTEHDAPASRAALARAYRQLGELHVSLGNRPVAVAAVRRALAILRQLTEGPEADPEWKLNLATALGFLAWVSQHSEDSEIEHALRDAQAIVEQVEARQGQSFESRLTLANLMLHQGNRFLQKGQLRDATAEFERIRVFLEPFTAIRPNDPAVSTPLGDVYIQLGVVSPDTASSRINFRKALRLHEVRLENNRDDLGARHGAAHCRAALGGTHDPADVRPEEAIADADAGRDLARELVREYPFVQEFRRVLALASFHAGCRYLLVKRLPEARVALEAALTHWQQLANDSPDVPTHRRLLARSRTMLAVVDLETGQPGAALNGLTLAAKELEAVIPHNNGDGNRARAFQAVSFRHLGLVHLTEGRTADAAAATRKARDILTPIWKNLTHMPRLRIELAACHATLAGLAGNPGADVPLTDGPVEAGKAMELLNTNLKDYYPHPLVLTGDRGFDSLRGNPDFERLLRDAKLP